MAKKKHALAVLIENTKIDQGWSDEDLAVRARRAGQPISKQHIANLRTEDPMKTIVPSTLRAIAGALGVPLGRVVEAAIDAAGLDPVTAPTDWSVQYAIRTDPELTEQGKRMLLAVLEEAYASVPTGQVRQFPREIQPPKPGEKVAARRKPN